MNCIRTKSYIQWVAFLVTYAILIAFMSVKIQWMIATQNLSYNPSCKTPFFYSVNEGWFLVSYRMNKISYT
jgi:hypothetical protein